MIPEPRYAIYLAPEPHEPLWPFGCAWLGYDAMTQADVKHPALPGISAETIREATAHPRLYGLHITLKAPFRLAEGLAVPDLEQAVEDLARRHDPFGPFQLVLEARKAGENDVFLCLAPAEQQLALHRLEADAVVTLDSFRAPLTPGELARRKPDRLGRRERSYLERYGYPHVLEAFRPHISLTGPISPDAPLRGALAERFTAEPELLCLSVLSILLFEQPEPGARFQIRQRYRLGA
jgi:hypothetical protein